MPVPKLSVEELRRQYNTNAAVPDHERYQQRYLDASNEAVSKLNGHLNLAYGRLGERQTLDFFAPTNGDAPIVVFIHGGYWRWQKKDERRFPAPVFVERGIAYVPINYRLMPGVTIDEIVVDVRAAIVWLYNNATQYGGNPNAIVVAGNSAGGHLVGMLLADDWLADAGLPSDVIKGACPVSGVFDLEPLLQAEPNEWMQMDRAMAIRNSPIHNLPFNDRPILIACGAAETGEFLRQSKVYGEALRDKGLRGAHRVELAEHNHFSIIGEFGDPDSKVCQWLCTTALASGSG